MKFNLPSPVAVPDGQVGNIDAGEPRWGLLIAFLSASGIVFLLCASFSPVWELNDDIAMSMVAHGYGIASYGSPQLVFSNVLWGHLVRAVPGVNGIPGYSIATLGTLILVGFVVYLGLLRLGAGLLAGFLVLFLLLLRPVLVPQFTINAGLLAVAALVAWQVHARRGDPVSLGMGGGLFFLSYLVRSQEFFLVLAVAAPCFPWKAIKANASMRRAVVLLAAAILLAALVDKHSYGTPEWSDFREVNEVRPAFTDYQAWHYLKERPEILVRNGLSANDVELFGSWFLADPSVANPEKLRSSLDELGPMPNKEYAAAGALKALQGLLHPSLLPLLIPALLLLALNPRRPLLAMWGICLAAVIIMGLMGRPGILRVYVPLASMLLVGPFVVARIDQVWGRLLPWLLGGACLVQVTYFYPLLTAQWRKSLVVQGALVDFPRDVVVMWGKRFPFEVVYPVLQDIRSLPQLRIYSLGSFTLAPYSVAYRENAVGRGLLERLLSPVGVPIVGGDREYRLLGRYCEEHFNGRLRELAVRKYGAVIVSWRQCDRGN